jgi:hypothetical protein
VHEGRTISKPTIEVGSMPAYLWLYVGTLLWLYASTLVWLYAGALAWL